MDRNNLFTNPGSTTLTSLSARRAWIEIGSADYVEYNYNVALRKESVDRNCVGFSSGAKADRSLSARRAWIEIPMTRRAMWAFLVALRKESVDRNFGSGSLFGGHAVALRKESVDRNISSCSLQYHGKRRSPQGERG